MKTYLNYKLEGIIADWKKNWKDYLKMIWGIGSSFFIFPFMILYPVFGINPLWLIPLFVYSLSSLIIYIQWEEIRDEYERYKQ
jgi:hypothetical protein